MQRNMRDDYPDEGFVVGGVFGGASDVDIVWMCLNEVDYHVEGGEAEVGVEFGDVFCEGLLGFGGGEGGWWVVDLPEGHFEICPVVMDLRIGVGCDNQFSYCLRSWCWCLEI